MANGFQVQLDNILDEYSKEVARATNNSIDVIAKEAVSKLKNTSPKRPGGGDYARSWGLKRKRGKSRINEVVVHNKNHYQLTHLLENGHVIRNGVGEYGRAPAIKHIQPVEQWANSELPLEIERELE